MIEALILAISLPLTTAARAPGKMAAYESILGTLQISILLISWVLLKAGFGPQSVFYIAIVVNLIMFVVRLEIVSRLTGLPVLRFLRGTMPRMLSVVVVSGALSAVVTHQLPAGVVFLGASVAIALLINSASIYYLGLPPAMRKMVTQFMFNKLKNVKNR